MFHLDVKKARIKYIYRFYVDWRDSFVLAYYSLGVFLQAFVANCLNPLLIQWIANTY